MKNAIRLRRERLRLRALRQGFVLKPIPPKQILTAAQVASGYVTARQVAEICGIAIAAASNRMKLAEETGLIRQAGERSCSGGGLEIIWRLALTAERMDELERRAGVDPIEDPDDPDGGPDDGHMAGAISCKDAEFWSRVAPTLIDERVPLEALSRHRRHGRRQPYTWAGVRRLPCFRCGEPAHRQWQVCADGRLYRPLCLDCDIELNRLVLDWMRFPDAGHMADRYELELRAEDMKVSRRPRHENSH